MKRKKRIGTVGKAIGCLFFLMVSLFPIYWLVAMAIRPTDEMRGHIALIPQSLTGIHFAELFSAKNFGTAIINSLQTTFGSLFPFHKNASLLSEKRFPPKSIHFI